MALWYVEINQFQWPYTPNRAQGASFYLVYRLYTVRHTRPVEFLWISNQLVAKPLPTQHKISTRHEDPCLQRDSNPRPQQQAAADLHLTPHGHCDRHVNKYLSLNKVLITYITHNHTQELGTIDLWRHKLI